MILQSSQKSQISSLPLHIHIVPRLELKSLQTLLVPCINFFHPQGKARTDFLHVHSLIAFGKDVSMVPEEDEIPLIVEGHHSSTPKLRLLREERSEQSAQSHSHFGVEVIEDELRDVLSGDGVVPYLLLELDTGDFKDCEHSLQVPHQQFPPVRIPQNHHMGVVQSLSMFVNFFQFHLSSGIKGNVVEDHHQLAQKVVDFYGGFELRCDEYLDWPIMLEYLIKLIEHRLVIILHELLPSLLLVLDRDWFLPHL